MSQTSIKVVCRLRPLNKIEITNNGEECVTFQDKSIQICVGGDQNKYTFAFDKILGPSCLQVEVYNEVAIPIIKSVISGFNGTVFAYGQTGGGKTWTMQGPNHHDPDYKGLIPRTIEGLFQQIAQSDENLEFVIKCSYVEIYNEKIFDLLDPSKARLQVKQDKHKGVFIQNCTQICVSSSDQMLKTMNNGSQNRKVAFTGMNQRSSRSHSLFIIHIFQKNTKKDSTKQSKLYFVDLAGSQKISKTGVVGQQLQQAKNINKSLSALGNVINALTSEKKQHIPYRDSKLTRILQESLGGNSLTTLIINCSMCTYNDKQTLGTLRFGYRAKSIKNKAKVNEQKSAKQLMILLQAANKMISDLKLQLKCGNGNFSPLQICEESNNSQNQLKQTLSRQQSQILSLKESVEQYMRQSQQKQKELKEYELRIKTILLQLDSQRQKHQFHLSDCRGTFKCLKQYLSSMNKYIQRALIDIQYFVNNNMLNCQNAAENQKFEVKNVQNNQKSSMKQFNEDIQSNLNNFINDAQHYINYYNQNIKSILENVDKQSKIHMNNNLEVHSDKGQYENMQPFNDKDSFQSEGERRKMKMAISEPQLFNDSNKQRQKLDQLQMSMIYQKGEESIGISNSDKISQQESFTEIQTLLQSLQTKESQKMIFQQMNYNLKSFKKQNEELNSKCQKLKAQNKNIMMEMENKYSQLIMDLQERAEEYKNIIGKKDSEITFLLSKNDTIKQSLQEEKVIADRFKKIIQGNQQMKNFYQMEQRVRSLASERQKIFNELFKLRSELDQAEINIKQKEDHIQSLKEVMKQLSVNQNSISGPNWSKIKEPPLYEDDADVIQKKYNQKVYGTETPNIIQPIKGGQDNGSGKKISNLRKKIPIQLQTKKQANKGIGSFIKGFFG